LRGESEINIKSAFSSLFSFCPDTKLLTGQKRGDYAATGELPLTAGVRESQSRLFAGFMLFLPWLWAVILPFFAVIPLRCVSIVGHVTL
jgi:hypothetical protein